MIAPRFQPRPEKSTLLREWNGPLTEDLVQDPGVFGLGKIPRRLKPDATTTSICGFCGTGCQLRVHLKDNEAVNLSAETHYPVNLGMACPKGWEALTPLDAPDRATEPLVRNTAGELTPTTWDKALRHFVKSVKGIQQRYGKHAFAWLGTGQVSCEEFAFLGALGKFGMGLRHGDGNTRQCMATAVSAYKESFGFDSPPFTYADFEQSDCLVFLGANVCIAHPIMWQRVMRNQRNPRIYVVDPRRTETAMAATHHLPIQPKSDLLLLYALAREVIANGWVRTEFVREHTRNFEAFAAFVQDYTIPAAAQHSGLPEAAIKELAHDIGTRERVSFWWTMGVNQSYEGTRVAQAMINLALMTGNIGRPGTGANSITGQCNAMGSRLFSNTTNLLGGHRFDDPDHRKKVAGILDIPEDSIPRENSYAYDQILDAVDRGEIRGLWLIATNPAHSWIQQGQLKERLDKLELLVVQDMYHNTLTAQCADIVLPAAGWGEKDGTMINSERRIGRIRKVRRAPGQALDDWSIFKAIAHYWGCADIFSRWNCPEDTFLTLKELTRGMPCDITGIENYDHLDHSGGIQWPLPEGSECPQRERRLFGNGHFFHPDQKARFCFEAPRPAPETTDADFPFVLLTGRGSSSQWHTGTRTEKSDVLRRLSPRKIYVEVNPLDAERLGIAPGSATEIQSRRASIRAIAHLTHSVQPGQVFIPMHFPEVNTLTRADFDPVSREPNYKFTAVHIAPAA